MSIARMQDRLRSVLKEAMSSNRADLERKAVEERERQREYSSALGEADDEPLFKEPEKDKKAAPEPTADNEKPLDDEKGTNPSDDAEALEKGTVSVDDIVEKLNTIRSGRSFRDSGVKGSMEKYIEDLDDAEKTALFAFLKGISEIVTGVVPGEEATAPAADPADVEMKKDPSKQTKHIKPNVINVPGKKDEKERSDEKGAEDTSAPLPVKAKSRGSK